MSLQRILIIDDYAPASQAMARLLRLGGHEVETALAAPEAMALVRGFHPEVVLLDLNLGGSTDGLTVARWIREETADDPVLLVAITGVCDADIEMRVNAAGFDRCLRKPIAFAELEAVIPGNNVRDA